LVLVGTRLLILRTNLRRSCRWFRGFVITHVLTRDAQVGWVSVVNIFPDFWSRFWTNLRPIFDKEFRKFDLDPFVFLIRKDPRLGQVPTLEGWNRQSACLSGTGLVQAHGTGTLSVPNLPHWDRERSKETCPLSHGQVIYPRERLSLSQGQALYPRWRPVSVPGQAIPTMEPVPVQPVPTCPIKWDYKAVVAGSGGTTSALRPSLVLNEFAGIPAFSQEFR